jgi:hypothetical protein
LPAAPERSPERPDISDPREFLSRITLRTTVAHQPSEDSLPALRPMCCQCAADGPMCRCAIGEEFLYCVKAVGFAGGSAASGRACGLRPVPPSTTLTPARSNTNTFTAADDGAPVSPAGYVLEGLRFRG